MRGIDTVRHELRYRPPAIWDHWKRARETARKRASLLDYFESIRRNPPDVLLGANIGRRHGVRHHLDGIRAHSSLNAELSPPDSLLDKITYHDLHTTLRAEVMAFSPRGVAVVHSHVYPYFIRWCNEHRDDGPLWVHTYHLPYFPIDDATPLEPWQAEINDTLVTVARNAHVRLSVSRWQASFLRSSAGIDTVHIPNGVDVKLCDEARSERFVSRVGADPFVLFVGRDDLVKNPADFVRLAARLPSLRFIAIGGGLAAGAASLAGTDPPPNLRFLGGLSRGEVQDAIAACAALVVTSRREGLPTLVLEGLAHRVPVIVPNEPGCLEAVDGGRFGRVYPAGDIEALAECTLSALSSREGLEQAREMVLDVYDWRVVARQLDSVYRGAS